jgi:hypothetical protein
LLALCGCAEGAKLVQETETGGVVAYLFKEDRGPMFSRYRPQAFDIMQKKCSSGYTIVREGETRGTRRVSGMVEGTEDDPGGRRWGIQFKCKSV